MTNICTECDIQKGCPNCNTPEALMCTNAVDISSALQKIQLNSTPQVYYYDKVVLEGLGIDQLPIDNEGTIDFVMQNPTDHE